MGVETVLWLNIKKLFNEDTEYDNLRKNSIAKKAAAKKSGNEVYKVVVNHDDYFEGMRYCRGGETFGTDIIPLSFDMELFDMWCRPLGVTQRWAEQPKWYINISPAYGSGNEVTQDKIKLVKEIIN